MRTKYLLLVALVSAFPRAGAEARTIAASSCNASDVQAAVNQAVTGDVVTIPAGTCTWTSQVVWSAPPNVTLQGAGSQTVVGGGDVTVIVDGINRGNDIAALDIVTSASGAFRLTGITFRGDGNSAHFTDNGTLRVGGGSQQVRLDHFHIDRIRRQGVTTGGLYGVIDHAIFDMVAGTLDNALRPNGVYTTFGDPEWAGPTNFGSSQFMYVEDSLFNNGIANDCVTGGRQVFRHNTFTNASMQTHPTGSQGRARGCRAMEIYLNTFSGGSCSPNCFNVHFVSSGALLIWGNSTGSAYQNFLTIHSMRRNNGTYGQSATPNGWGYCGSSFNGTGSNWDQNSSTSAGYACLDQPGRGQGDRLVNDFPNATNQRTGSISWPNQALEPIYEWLDTWTGSGGGSFMTVYDSPSLSNNQDYYFQCGSKNSSCASFNGTAGTGTGTLSGMPSSCAPSVGYWATDTNTLYVCSAPNTWMARYRPYAYPHPLIQGGGGGSTPPATPTNLRIFQ